MGYQKPLGILFGLYLLSLVTSMSGMEIFSGLLVAFLIGLALTKRELFQKIPKPPALLPMFGFIAAASLSLLISDSPQKLFHLGQLRFFLFYPVVYYTLHLLPNDYPWLKLLMGFLVVVGIYSTLQHFIPLDLIRPEGKKVILYAYPDEKIGLLVVGFFNHHLTFANIFLLYACLFTGLGFAKSDRRFQYLGLGLWIFLLCFWTQSRVAWIAVASCLFLFTALKSWKFGAACIAFIIGLGVFSYNFDAGFQTRFRKTFLEKNDFYNLGPRSRLWRANWQMFLDHPILGIGYNNNEPHSKEYFDRLFPDLKDPFYGHAHSMPLHILACTGILGSLFFLWIWGQLFLTWWRRIRGVKLWNEDQALTLGIGIAFVGFWIQGLTQWNFGDAEVIHSVFFLMALFYAQPSLSTSTKA